MRVNSYIAPFILCPILAFANTNNKTENILFSMPFVPEILWSVTIQMKLILFFRIN